MLMPFPETITLSNPIEMEMDGAEVVMHLSKCRNKKR
jgi:hypothetical protein